MAGSVRFDWGDSTYTFRLDIGDVRELQDNPHVGIGPLALLRRIQSGNWKADDIPEVIRLALIRGSNIAPVKATKLVQRYYHEADKTGAADVAMRILCVYLVWPEDDPVGKTQAEAMNGQATESPSPNSTPQVVN